MNSGIQTVDGNYVWLFQDSTDPTVVIGVIGTSDPAAEPAETGPLALSFALISTSDTNADLYTVQYVPLLHPDATDPDDQIDLTDKVFASVTGTTMNNFSGQNAAPGNHDFYVINSSNDATKQLLVTGFEGAANATANVSTQGFGVDNQSINPTETLQVDFVTGGTCPQVMARKSSTAAISIMSCRPGSRSTRSRLLIRLSGWTSGSAPSTLRATSKA